MITITGYAMLVFGPALLAVAAALAGVMFYIRQQFRVSLSVILVILNLAGALLYLTISRKIGSTVGSNEFPVAEAASWFLYAVPIFALFALADVVVFVMALYRFYTKKVRELSVLAALVPALWIVAFYVETVHH